MNGLTKRLRDVLDENIRHLSEIEKDIIDTALDRLAAYEATGLEPEEVGGMKTAYDENQMPYMVEATGREAAHIYDMLLAEAEERLVILPCKAGDRVYISGHRFPAQIEEIVIDALNGITFNWAEYDRGPEETELWDDGWFTPAAFGKTVFLTREEAEAALKGARDND